ncbi:uncharacterized protein KIAA0825 homolog [Protopterus annectens]|uniref:uncharacterized protein KIAA0825 homolog n=1 Tax=Protopterus annectens TaxID=7888 RepID=UPI001CFBA375|nr:uncharacterized protein KIAA0825 homolog [Protopterus annectens]
MEWDGEHLLDLPLSAFPGEQDFQQVIGDIDAKLKENALCIEQNFKDLQLAVSDLCSEEIPSNVVDPLQWLTDCSVSFRKPLSTHPDQLLEFLKCLQHFLKTEQGQEEMVFQFLLDLSSQCGVIFPSFPSVSSFHFTSSASVCAVDDDCSMDIKSVWDDVRFHLRRFVFDKIRCYQESDISKKIHFQIYCLKQLQLLFPDSEVLTKYQNMRSKVVQDFLKNSVLTYSEELNFDKVAYSYQTAVPVLCTMVEEDLYTLIGITDPMSVVKLINETHLSSTVEELSTVIERLYELHFKESTKHATKAIKSTNKQKGAVHVLDAQEEIKKGKNFSFTSHQLKCLAHLAKVLLCMESKVEHQFAELVLCGRGMAQNVQGRMFSHKLLEGGISESQNIRSERLGGCVSLKSASGLMARMYGNSCDPEYRRHYNVNISFSNVTGLSKQISEEELMKKLLKSETSSQTHLLLHVDEPPSLEFCWRNIFRDVSVSLASCLKSAVEDICLKCLQYEQNDQSSAAGYSINVVNIQHVKGSCGTLNKDEQPKKVAKFCSDIMEEVEALLPLAVACRDDGLQEIRANFVEACCKVATAVLARLKERSNEIPSKAPVQNLYAILSTAIHVLQFLNHCEASMKEISKKPLFLVPVQRYQEFINRLRFQVTDYCLRVCTTVILQDAECHHWDDTKSFYEGERCSFSIQMWHYYSCALRHDLWSVLPPKLAQNILAEVISESLAFLTYRYCQAQPSCGRVPQMRADITAILLYTESLLWSVCSSPHTLLQPNEDTGRCIFMIHSHCNSLLTALAIVTSPLTNLYQIFQNNLQEVNASPLKCANLHLVDWLYKIKPELFQDNSTRSPSVELAALGHLKLLLSQPCCNWNLLLQTMLHHDCFILRILLANTGLDDQKNTNEKGSTEGPPTKPASLIKAVFMILSNCNLAPKALGDVLACYMDKHRLWDALYNLSDVRESELEILRCLHFVLTNSVKNTIEQVISLVCGWQKVDNHGSYFCKQTVPESLLKKIPKEWNYTPGEFKRKESGKSSTRLLAQAVSFVISHLPTVVASIPFPIKYLFYLAEQRLTEKAGMSQRWILVWNLIMILSKVIEDGNAAESLTGQTLDSWSKDKLSLLSKCLQSLIGQEAGSSAPVIEKVIQSIENQRGNWIEDHLQKARKLISEGAFMSEKSSAFQEEGSTVELTEQKIAMMVLDICHKPGGGEYLRQIYHIIQLNEDFLKECLPYENVSEKVAFFTCPLNLILPDTEEKTAAFNPLVVFSHCGDACLEQSAITEWNWDWSYLLPSCWGLSQTTFRTLLANR